MKKSITFFAWFGVLILVGTLAGGLGCSREQAPPPPPPQPSAAPAPAQPMAPAPGSPAAPGAPAAAPGTPAPNTAQVTMGMTMDQVKQIMGNPAETKMKGQVTEWKYYTPNKFEVKFQNNQVVAVETH